jgi:Uma2 family endonuclease
LTASFDHPLGEVVGAGPGFALARDLDTVLAPDVAFVRADRVPPEVEQDGFWSVVPALVVEVISPADTVRYVVDKIAACLAAGVEVVLTIAPRRRTFSIHTGDGVSRTLQESDTLGLPDILPGFKLPVAEIFRRVRKPPGESAS